MRLTPPWRVINDNHTVAVEWNFLHEAIDGLIARGHEVEVAQRFETEFSCAQMAMKTEHCYVAASEHRKVGYSVGL